MLISFAGIVIMFFATEGLGPIILLMGVVCFMIWGVIATFSKSKIVVSKDDNRNISKKTNWVLLRTLLIMGLDNFST